MKVCSSAMRNRCIESILQFRKCTLNARHLTAAAFPSIFRSAPANWHWWIGVCMSYQIVHSPVAPCLALWPKMRKLDTQFIRYFSVSLTQSPTCPTKEKKRETKLQFAFFVLPFAIAIASSAATTTKIRSRKLLIQRTHSRRLFLPAAPLSVLSFFSFSLRRR